MLLKQLINTGIETISPLYPEREVREMVFMLLEHILGTKRHTHIIEPSYEVGEDKVSEVMQAFKRLAGGEPLQYVTGRACFYGRDFHVNPSVLIPRPETEILCRTALEFGKGGQVCGNGILPPPAMGRDPRSGEHLAAVPHVLDLCTGSGCIAWTMALECPGAEVTAVDISDDALEVARNQDFAEEMACTGAKAPSFVKADVLAGHDNIGTFDLILSNPPYVMDKEKSLMRQNVLEHEPHLALFVPDEDPLVFYRAVAQWSVNLLASDGTGIVEINEALGPETAQVFKDSDFSYTEIIKDLTDRDRFVLFRR